ncbi:MAG: hypothetical protein O3A85_14905 [Proteobacteria bacterium]|nr:hypothetical protein [Pseudomonadota bacterium]
MTTNTPDRVTHYPTFINIKSVRLDGCCLAATVRDTSNRILFRKRLIAPRLGLRITVQSNGA